KLHVFFAVAELDAPRNRALFLITENTNAVTEWSKVSITAYVNCLMRARFYTGVAFPAHVGFDVVGAAKRFIDVHDVRRTDINTLTTTITTGHIYKSWHNIFSLF